MEVPPVQYVQRPDGVSIAYQVLGDGGADLVLVPGFISHIDLHWTDPGFTRFAERLSRFARVAMYDKPGTGLSDPISHIPDIEERARDIKVVMDAAGMRRPALLGYSEGGAPALMLATMAPERVRAVVLYAALALGDVGRAVEEGVPREVAERAWARLDAVVENWGSGRLVELLTPDCAHAARRRFFGIFERAAASPAMARALFEAAQRTDVTAILPSVRVPTLVLHRTGDFVPVEFARLIADRVQDARLVELPGSDHAFWFSQPEQVLDEVEGFLTGQRSTASPERVLATVLFSDIAGSTEQAAALGDRVWRSRLETHDASARDVVAAHGGRVVKSLGDGHLSVFDGPARAVRCALALRDAAARDGLRLRCGVHTGECEAMGDDVGGLAVHIGARVGAMAQGGEVVVSSTVKELVLGSDLQFSERGEHELKGVPGRWRLFSAGEREPPPAIPDTRPLRSSERAVIRAARRAPSAARAAARLSDRLGRRG